MKTHVSYELAHEHVLRCCDSYQRLPEVLALKRRMYKRDWWRLLGEEWSGFDNLSAYRIDLTHLLDTARIRDLHAMMNDAERTALAAQSETFTVYRGCYTVNRAGLSWTLSREVAERFPKLKRYRRTDDTPLLLTGQAIRSRSVMKLDRDEQEVVSAEIRVVVEQPVEEQANERG